MRGSIRTKEKCPKCYGSFKGNPLHCPACLTTPKKYFIDIFQKGYGRLRLFSDKTGHPLDSYLRAQRVLESIRNEIDQKTFDPKKYAAADIKDFKFENRIQYWYEGKQREVEKENLAESYTKKLKCYIDQYYTPFFKSKDVREIRTFHVKEFYDQLPKKSLKYYKNIMDALRNFFNSLYLYEYITQKPVFPKITVDKKAPKWLTYEGQLRMIEDFKTHYPDDVDILIFCAFQGIRPGEARGLKIRDVNFETTSLTVQRTYSGSSPKLRERVKSKVVRPRLINPDLLPMLKRHCKDKLPDAFVFVNPRNGQPYSYSSIDRRFTQTRKRLGLDVTFYQATRHSVGSIAASNGVSLKAIQDVLGHTDIRTTLKYAHSDLQSQAAVFKKPAIVKEILAPVGHQQG